MSNAIIQVHELSFEYPGYRALDHVSLTLEAGTVTALVGPNGAGKTTLMRCIAALDTPLSGRVLVNGLDVHEHPREAHQLMGYLSDSFGLYADLTVTQVLTYAASSQGLPAGSVDAAVKNTAQRLGLSDKLNQPAGTLSRGQRQRVAIGQSIIHSPRVLLLDEPASGLDPEARSSLAGVFRDLQAQGMTLLVSSHILAELDEYSTHMLALSEGHVLEHRALGASQGAGADSHERRLRFEFASDLDAAAAWLAGRSDLRGNTTHGGGVDAVFTGPAIAQAALVAECVASGHALTVIAPVTENLQQSYLKSLEAGRSARTRPGA
ncbi:MAG: transporter related protein [Pseudomonadota bacterium]